MRTRAAVLRAPNTAWTVEEIELDDPRELEILVRTTAAGLCHSDEHAFDGSTVAPLPLVGGHEAAGIVVARDDRVTSVAPGDHVAVSITPSCGRCRWCASGQQQLCDAGMHVLEPGMMPPAGGFRHHSLDGSHLSPFLKIGAFAEHMVLHADSVVKVEPAIPAIAAALVSCGVATGYGSVVNRAGVQPGETVVVVGCGGVGTAAIQAAALAGARIVAAVDPLDFKRRTARQLGATHDYGSIEEATDAIRDLTRGVMADSVILTPSVMRGDMIGPAVLLTRKGGTVVVTAVAPHDQELVHLNLVEFAMMNKELKGTLFGSGSPQQEIPRLLSMYEAGQLKLDEMVTTTYSLDRINEGFEAMRAGTNIRGVIVFD